jgi:hypothetical protein
MSEIGAHLKHIDQPARRRQIERARGASRQAAAKRLAGADRQILPGTERPIRDSGSHPTPGVRALAPPTETRGSDSGSAPARRFAAALSVFLAAVLTVVGAVWVAAVVNQWWILIPIIAVLVLATFAVLATVLRLLDGDR